jgi:hypothetical protein
VMDCFASLAMTWIGRGVLDPPHARRMTALAGATPSTALCLHRIISIVPEIRLTFFDPDDMMRS